MKSSKSSCSLGVGLQENFDKVFAMVDMEDCPITVTCIEENSVRSGHLRIELDPPMEQWRYLSMTRMEAQIVLNDILMKTFEDFRCTHLTDGVMATLANAMEAEVRHLVQRGMFVGRRPVPPHRQQKGPGG